MLKKVRNLILAAVLCCGIVQVQGNSITQVEAKTSYQYYPMNCSAYEVDTVNSSGKFDQQGCYADFESAKAAMKSSGDDAVVRHAASYSPTYVIAMNSGVSYAYPMRDGSSILTISQYNGSKTTYMQKHNEMAYYETLSYDGNGNGKVHVNVSGFDGIVDLKDIDLVPMKYISDALCLYLGGNDTTSENEQPFYTHISHSVYTVEQNGNYLDLRLTAYWGWSTGGGWPAAIINSAIAPAADWMKEGEKYYSPDAVHYYTDMKYQNLAGVYYPYYMFLPLRTKSNISADTFDNYLNDLGRNGKLNGNGQLLKNAESTYGINALMVFAQACIESAYGTSSYAVNRNNLFGVAAYDSNPDNAYYFKSIADSINQQSGLLLRSYSDTTSWLYYGSYFGNKAGGITVKYASSIYYGAAVSALAYTIDKYANGWNGNLTDYGTHTIGVVNTTGAAIQSTPGGSTLYTSDFGNSYQVNSMVAMIGESGDYYKIQSTDYLYQGAIITNTASYDYLTYNWDTMVGYIRKDQVDIVYNGSLTVDDAADNEEPADSADQTSNTTAEEEAAGEAFSSVDEVSWSDDGSTATIKGIAFIAGLNAVNNVSHTLLLVNDETKETIEIPATTAAFDSDTAPYGDGRDYTNIVYEADLNLCDIPEGNYYLAIRVTNGNVTKEKILYTNIDGTNGSCQKDDGTLARLFTNPLSNYRLDVSVEKQSVDFSVINKPSRRTSLFGYESMTLDQGSLNISGYAMIYLTDTTAEQNPSYALLLEDEEGNVTSFDLNVKESPVNFGTLLRSKYTMDYASFEESLDLSQLPAGDYRVYLDLVSGDYRDVIELYNISDSSIPEVTYDGRTYSLQTTAVRNRYILSIAD